MKTRPNSASAQPSQIKHKKIKKEKRKVKANEVIFAMNDLIKNDGGSLLQVEKKHYRKLARRLDMSPDDIRSIVKKTQPRVIVKKM